MDTADGVQPNDPDEATDTRRMMKIVASPGFKSFLVDNKIAIAFTTYQSGRLMLAGGHRSNRRMHFSELKLQRPMGLALRDGVMAVALRNQIITYVNAFRGARVEGDSIDAIYAAQTIDITTDIDTHDIAFGADGALYFINTRFSCLCTPSREFAFKPVWKPDFIGALTADDRCHLNGLAMRDGKPAYVTVAARTDEARKWKENRVGAGAIIDVSTDAVVADGLTMPHSPRWHDNRLWVLNSGHGELCTVDISTGRLTPVIFLPGYLRGLSFAGKYAVIGLSKPRENSVFDGLPLQQEIERRDLPPSCGIAIVDTETGTLAHMLTFEGDVTELYDTGVLPGLDQPIILPPEGDAKYRIVTIEPGLPAPDAARVT